MNIKKSSIAIFVLLLFTSLLLLFYQNCAGELESGNPDANVSSDDIFRSDGSLNTLTRYPSCYGSDNKMTFTFDDEFGLDYTYDCLQLLPVRTSHFVDCLDLSLDSGAVDITLSGRTLTFSGLTSDAYNMHINVYNSDGVLITAFARVSFANCENSNICSTPCTECQDCVGGSCVNKDNSATCGSCGYCFHGRCDEPNCCSDSDCTSGQVCNATSGNCEARPLCAGVACTNCQDCVDGNCVSKTITCGSGNMESYPSLSSSGCGSTSRTECGTTCWTVGSTCGDCQDCVGGSCVAKTITCGADPMANYPNTVATGCGSTSKTDCGTTCWNTGSTCTTCQDCVGGSCVNKTITCGSDAMSGYPHTTSNGCGSTSKSECGTTCWSDASSCGACQDCVGNTCVAKTITCGADPMANYPNTAATGCGSTSKTECGTTCYTTGSTCNSCQDCVGNSCVAKTVTCGSGSMASHPNTVATGCGSTSKTECGTTCWSTGSTCNSCQDCVGNSCVAKTITCGSGSMTGYSNTVATGCGSTSKTECGTTCWSTGSTCNACQDCVGSSCVAKTISCGSGTMARFSNTVATGCGSTSKSECGTTCYTTGSTCNSCQDCVGNSCVAKTITCGSGTMAGYPNTRITGCGSRSRSECGTTCYTTGSICGNCQSCSGGRCTNDCTYNQRCINNVCEDPCSVRMENNNPFCKWGDVVCDDVTCEEGKSTAWTYGTLYGDACDRLPFCSEEDCCQD